MGAVFQLCEESGSSERMVGSLQCFIFFLAWDYKKAADDYDEGSGHDLYVEAA